MEIITAYDKKEACIRKANRKHGISYDERHAQQWKQPFKNAYNLGKWAKALPNTPIWLYLNHVNKQPHNAPAYHQWAIRSNKAGSSTININANSKTPASKQKLSSQKQKAYLKSKQAVTSSNQDKLTNHMKVLKEGTTGYQKQWPLLSVYGAVFDSGGQKS